MNGSPSITNSLGAALQHFKSVWSRGEENGTREMENYIMGTCKKFLLKTRLNCKMIE